jgi:hypothetical protein
VCRSRHRRDTYFATAIIPRSPGIFIPYPLFPLYPVKTRQNWGASGACGQSSRRRPTRHGPRRRASERAAQLDKASEGPKNACRQAVMQDALQHNRVCSSLALHPIGGTKRNDLDYDSTGGVGVGMRRREMLEYRCTWYKSAGSRVMDVGRRSHEGRRKMVNSARVDERSTPGCFRRLTRFSRFAGCGSAPGIAALSRGNNGVLCK